MMAFSIRLLSIWGIVSLSLLGSLADPSTCPRPGVDSVVAGIRSQCPRWIKRLASEEVTGDELDRILGNAKESGYYSILFYASWCPFSNKVRPAFDTLSTMFPHIRHLAIEESSAMPSVLSRYGIHSFPSLMIANRTSKMQYHGVKNLNSFINFYEETTGLSPVAYIVEETNNKVSRVPLNPQEQSITEIMRSEPYMSFAVAFIFLKALVCFFPVIISRIKALLSVLAQHLSLGIFGEWNHLLERVLHVIDLKKLWSKLRLCNKARNFQKGATNARVWASSLASVSLGESSSSRDS